MIDDRDYLLDITCLGVLIDFWNKMSEQEALYWTGRKEHDFEVDVREALKTCGVLAIKVPDKFSEYTFPDLLCHTRLASGKYLTWYMEMKARNKKIKKGSNQESAFAVLGKACPVFLVNNAKSLADALCEIKKLAL
jgi:hypothetical protein